MAPGKPSDIVSLALLGRVATTYLASDDLTEDLRRLLLDSLTAVIEAFDRLDPTGQAWLIGTLVRGPATEPIFAKARSSDDRAVKLAYISHCLTGPDDPMLAAARRDEDPVVRRTAELLVRLVAERQQ